MIWNFFVKYLFVLILWILKNEKVKKIFKKLIVNIIYLEILKGINKINF